MADEQTTITEAAETISTCGWKSGIFTGYEEAANLLLVEAGHAFTRHNDDQAELLRNMSDRLNAKARALRAEYTRDFEPLRAAAFDVLDKAKADFDAKPKKSK